MSETPASARCLTTTLFQRYNSTAAAVTVVHMLQAMPTAIAHRAQSTRTATTTTATTSSTNNTIACHVMPAIPLRKMFRSIVCAFELRSPSVFFGHSSRTVHTLRFLVDDVVDIFLSFYWKCWYTADLVGHCYGPFRCSCEGNKNIFHRLYVVHSTKWLRRKRENWSKTRKSWNGRRSEKEKSEIRTVLLCTYTRFSNN